MRRSEIMRFKTWLTAGAIILWGFGVQNCVSAQDEHDHAAHEEEDERHDKHAGHNHEGHEEEEGHVDHEGHDCNGEEQHDDADEHSGHDHDADKKEGMLSLTPEQREHFGIELSIAGEGDLKNEVSLPGEIVFNEDRVVHIVPRVAGIAREVFKGVGDRVVAGEVLAVIDSRELADAKSAYLAAKARDVLAEKIYAREKTLRDKQISSEQDYMESEQALVEAQIELLSAEQKLHALGISEDAIRTLDGKHSESITRYKIKSPLDGVVTKKHISLGESLAADSDIFTIVDTSSVWVKLTVYAKNLNAIQPNQNIRLRVDHSGEQAYGKITMVTPFVDAVTRSATARIVVDNSDGHWIPGTFVTGFSAISEEKLSVVVERNAVQNIEGRDVVFVENGEEFEPVPVVIGRSDSANVEVITGLEPGMRYVSKGAFQVKATIITSSLGGHAGHGH